MSEVVRDTPVHISSDDIIILLPDQPVMYQKCCDCGLVHRIEVSPRTEEIRFRHVNIGYEFPPDIEMVTHVERAKV